MLMCVVIFFFLLMTGSAASAEGVNVERNSITLSMSSEPGSLDSSLVEGTVGAAILRNIQEGLIRFNRRGQVVPGVAERWEVNGLEVTFWLRKDAEWQDGHPVTAHDFAYAWRRLVDPKTGAGGSTFYVYIFENGKEILAGEKSPDSLGVRVINDQQLKIRLSRPTPYFLKVLGGAPYFPLRQEFVDAQAGRYAADASNLLSNGPFILEHWLHSASLTLTKNPQYWNADNVTLDEVDFAYITPDIRSRFNLYRDGELAALILDKSILEEAMSSGQHIRKSRTNCASWILMSFDPERMTSNLNLRRALSMAIDRDAYVNSIVGLPGTKKIDSIFPSGIIGQSRSFQKEFPPPVIELNISRAKEYLEEAKRELEVEEIPPLVLLSSETTLLQAEFVQAQLLNALGLEIRVDSQTFKQWLDKAMLGDFDLMRDGYCSGAMTDPVFWAGIFESTSSWNTFGYHNPHYDELMMLTHTSGDQAERMRAFGGLQKILFDDVVVIPTHEPTMIYLQNNRLKHLLRYPVVDYSQGRISR